jgi:hypothetical protein
LLPEAVWNSGVSVATEDRPFLLAALFSTRQSHSVSLCGLSLCGRAVVAPRRFHFTITALTVDQGSSSRADIWRADSYDGATLKVTELFSKAILLPMFLWRLHGCVFDFIHLSATRLAVILLWNLINLCSHLWENGTWYTYWRDLLCLHPFSFIHTLLSHSHTHLFKGSREAMC